MPIVYDLILEDGSKMAWIIVGVGKIVHVMEVNYNVPKYLETFTINSTSQVKWVDDRLKLLKVKIVRPVFETI